jgi:NAD(P)-dependent dehydrogenase (short-subunit alcohol dehydrogenase family)
VAGHAQVEKAATEIEAQFGLIDVWINVAFTSHV